MKYERENLIKLNKNEKIPQFSGIFYHFKTAARKVSQDDDEFVSIEEESQTSVQKNGNANYENSVNGLKFTVNVKHQNQTPQNNLQPSTYNNYHNKSNQSYITGLNTKKNINDLDSLFDSIPNPANNPESQSATLNPSNLIINKMMNNVNSNNQETNDKFEDDEFVDIEENEANSRKQSVDNNQVKMNINNNNLAFDNKFPAQPEITNVNKDLQVEMPNLNQTQEIQKQELNFQDLIFNKDYKATKKNTDKMEEEVQNFEFTNTNESTKNSTTQPENKPKVSLDDLFGSLEINVPKTEPESKTEANTDGINTIGDKNNQQTLLTNTSIENDSKKQEVKNSAEVDDLEFCEVEEKEDMQANTKFEFTDKLEYNNGNNHPTNIIENNIFDSSSATNITVKKTAENKIFTKITNDSKNVFEFTSSEPHENYNQVEAKEEIPKVSIINYTPQDFLNEFKKENKVISSEVANNDEFEFVEEKEEDSKPIESQSSPADVNLSPMEMISRYKIKNENLTSKIKDNLTKLGRSLIKEYDNINSQLSQLKQFLISKQFSKFLFENDRKLTTFISSALQMIRFGNKIISALRCMDMNSDKDLQNYRKKLIATLKDILKIPEEKFKISLQIDIVELEENIKPFVFNIQDTNNQICHLCLHNLSNDTNTNIFGYDFHVNCINYWLNLITNHSPFN